MSAFNILSLAAIFLSIFPRLAIATDIVLDLNQTKSDDHVDVLNTEHYGLQSLEYYPKEGFKFSEIVEGQLPIWKHTNTEFSDNVILYYGKEPLSLLYVRVIVDGKESLKYYVKVSGQWKEVLETVLRAFFWVDRKKYTEAYLNQVAEDYIKNTTSEMLATRIFMPQSFQFILEPHYRTELDIVNPNEAFIMVQRRIGATFCKVFTPRTEFGIMTVKYNTLTIWEMNNDQVMCSSVFVHFKGRHDDLIVVNLFNFHTGETSYVPYKKTSSVVVELSSKELLRLLTNMTLDEYTQKDIELYKDGYLKERDFAFVLSTVFALTLTALAVCYNL